MVKTRLHPKTYCCTECGKEAEYRVSKRNTYCSITCQQTTRYKNYIKQWLSGELTGAGVNGPSKHVKRYILELQEHKCAKCSIDSWNNKPIVLELEHIDGQSSNNEFSNLECLCPNCHSQTASYKGANRGNGRHSRRIRYAEGKSF
jgi:hypothetical protein